LHSSELFKPVTVLKNPNEHSLQIVVDASEYFPGLHIAQLVLEANENYPGGHGEHKEAFEPK
jgi:hypothetical protein